MARDTMVHGFELTGLAGTLLLGAPILVLLVIVVLGTRYRGGPRGRVGDAEAPLSTSTAATGAEQDHQAALDFEAKRQQDLRRKRDARARADRLVREIGAAERKGPESALAALYLEAGRTLLVLGDGAAAGEQLRKSLVSSQKLGLKLEHAQARIELGDLSADQGDLTTACEHWSIARSMVHDLKRLADIEAVEARIRDNGCPTDWVLNDF